LSPWIGGGPYYLGGTESNWFLHEFDSQNFLWDINDREGRKVLGFLYGYHLPFDLRTRMRRWRSRLMPSRWLTSLLSSSLISSAIR